MTYIRFIKRNLGPAMGAALVVTTLSARAGLGDWIDHAGEVLGTSDSKASSTQVGSLSNREVTEGLKQALIQGAQSAVDDLGRADGFLGNQQVRIPIPEKLEAVEKGMRALGQGDTVDAFVTSMNRAAEQAVPLARDLFLDSITHMSLADAQAILSGPDDAATRYLKRQNGEQLQALMKPIIAEATANAGATQAYKNMYAKAGLLATAANLSAFDLDEYVTTKATDGLFAMIAAEEKRIRENPVARTTELLKRVFSSAPR